MLKELFDRMVGDSDELLDQTPVVLCFVMCKGELLLLRRTLQVDFYKGWWSVVAGVWDEKRVIEEKVREKITQELGVLATEHIQSLKLGRSYSFYDSVLEKGWCMHPVFVELDEKPWIYLNTQHQTFRWVNPSDMRQYDVIPSLADAFERFVALAV
ncbi:MAG: NUDIX domain-containing protein [Nanoarchaeota archaeon]|nr:NUDIX domain-containing protein [Nanoarchaeota archaeon]